MNIHAGVSWAVTYSAMIGHNPFGGP